LQDKKEKKNDEEDDEKERESTKPSADLTLQVLVLVQLWKEARQSDTKVDADRAFSHDVGKKQKYEISQDELETQDNYHYHSLEQQDYYNTPGCCE
jgi:hypothetical protein